ncbi:MAG: FecR family protein [Mangrovibacterium sp.]
MEEELLLHILTGKATSDEKKEFYSMLEGDKEKQQMFYQLKSLWIKSSAWHSPGDAEEEFNRLWRKIKYKDRSVFPLLTRTILRYAAAILLILGIGGMAGYFISSGEPENSAPVFHKFRSLKGSVSVIEMNDGTKVWLNAGSELEYAEDTKKRQRIAVLKGEAYFEIKHRDNFPLLITANEIVVRDLGTTFNIRAYPDDQTIETALVEGSAEILTKKGTLLASLKPGENASYSSNGKSLRITPISENVLAAWRSGKFVIRDQRLEDIFKEIGRWYDIEFQFENDHLRDYRYTGSIKKSVTAQGVLKLLSVAAKFNYRVVENPSLPDIIIVY